MGTISDSSCSQSCFRKFLLLFAACIALTFLISLPYNTTLKLLLIIEIKNCYSLLNLSLLHVMNLDGKTNRCASCFYTCMGLTPN